MRNCLSSIPSETSNLRSDSGDFRTTEQDFMREKDLTYHYQSERLHGSPQRAYLDWQIADVVSLEMNTELIELY